jgi:hypothetical protein
MEQVGYPLTSIKNVFLFAIQSILTPIYYPISNGGYCNRRTWIYIENAGFKSLELNFEFPDKMLFIQRPIIWGIAKM